MITRTHICKDLLTSISVPFVSIQQVPRPKVGNSSFDFKFFMSLCINYVFVKHKLWPGYDDIYSYKKKKAVEYMENSLFDLVQGIIY